MIVTSNEFSASSYTGLIAEASLVSGSQPKMSATNIDFYYGSHQVLKDVSLSFNPNQITALIGPSGCGKSTFLRCLNRMNDLIPEASLRGTIALDNQDIYSPDLDVVDLRKRVGMVFQRPTPFAKSIYDNVAYGLRLAGEKNKDKLDAVVEDSLKKAALWKEVKDRLNEPALSLSGGQQQRLCIARALAVNPEVLLMDEPASALDPIATQKLEESIQELKNELCIVIVTHSMQQALRISDNTAFFYMGELIEIGSTDQIFNRPLHARTRDYVNGTFG